MSIVIGIDIDNVISNFDDVLLKEFIKEDINKRNTGIINNEGYITDMFDWSKEEIIDFWKKNIERISKELDLVENAKYYIDKLSKEGHRIILISGRGKEDYQNPYELTTNWLEEKNITYDKLFLTDNYYSDKKAIICREQDIDLMIDDSSRVYTSCKNNNIECILFGTRFNKNKKGYNRLDSWEKIYNYIKNIKEE